MNKTNTEENRESQNFEKSQDIILLIQSKFNEQSQLEI